MQDKAFMGIVLGGDMNSYAVARAFYEAYGIRTLVLGQHPIFPTRDSRLIEGWYFEDLLSDAVLLQALERVQAKYPDKAKFLFGNTDYYVRHIIHNREKIQAISSSFLIPTVSEAMFDRLFNKESFYELCEQYGLPYPRSVSFRVGLEDLEQLSLPFAFPVFAKPANSVAYAQCSFAGKQKGYRADTPEQLQDILERVAAAGYRDSFLLQEYIEGDDESMFVYTAYVSRDHRVQAITGGKILMHDRTPELIGNYNAITNARDEALCSQLKAFLEKIEFTGICHFDVQYDKKRQGYVVFEMNIRQGRSNLYTLASGVNLAKLLVEDHIENKSADYYVADREFTVSVVPKWMLRYALKSSGAKTYPIRNFYRFGLCSYDRNPKRWLYQLLWTLRTMKNHLKYNR